MDSSVCILTCERPCLHLIITSVLEVSFKQDDAEYKDSDIK